MVKKVEKKVETKITPKVFVNPLASDLVAIEKKRNELINEIKPKLLTVTQLRIGGSDIRRKHLQEQGYAVVMGEINELGAKLSLRPIGLGSLRKG